MAMINFRIKLSPPPPPGSQLAPTDPQQRAIEHLAPLRVDNLTAP